MQKYTVQNIILEHPWYNFQAAYLQADHNIEDIAVPYTEALYIVRGNTPDLYYYFHTHLIPYIQKTPKYKKLPNYE